MNKEVRLEQLYPVMQEMLENGGTVNFNPKGTSMLPMLHNDGDRVVIKKADSQLKKYDLPLYRRKDGQFVLHRVVRKPQNGIYSMCGDNQWVVENGITHNQIVGVVVSFNRSGKEISVENPLYKLYCRIWVAAMPLRRLVIGGRRYLKQKLKKH